MESAIGRKELREDAFDERGQLAFHSIRECRAEIFATAP